MEQFSSLHLNSPSPIQKSIDAVQHYLNDQKDNLDNAVAHFRDEISGQLQKAKACINFITLPVNNFIKDCAQIEKELAAELHKNEEYCICMDGKMIQASEVLLMKMEENY